jgi:hypothetical protein
MSLFGCEFIDKVHHWVDAHASSAQSFIRDELKMFESSDEPIRDPAEIRYEKSVSCWINLKKIAMIRDMGEQNVVVVNADNPVDGMPWNETRE